VVAQKKKYLDVRILVLEHVLIHVAAVLQRPLVLAVQIATIHVKIVAFGIVEVQVVRDNVKDVMVVATAAVMAVDQDVPDLVRVHHNINYLQLR
jgi:hypothetical protein